MSRLKYGKKKKPSFSPLLLLKLARKKDERRVSQKVKTLIRLPFNFVDNGFKSSRVIQCQVG